MEDSIKKNLTEIFQNTRYNFGKASKMLLKMSILI